MSDVGCPCGVWLWTWISCVASRGTDACSRTLARHTPAVPRAQAAAATAAAKAEAAKAAAAKAKVAKAGAAKASVAKAGAARAKAAKAKAVKAGVARAKAAKATKAATEPLRRRRLRGRRLAATAGAPEASRVPGICWRADREVYHVYDKRVFLGSAPSLGEAVSPRATAGLLVAGFGDLLFSPVFVV